MYLVNIRLKSGSGGGIPSQVSALAAAIRAADGVEHVSVTSDPQGEMVLGLFVLATSLVEAEGRALDLLERALDASEELAGMGWTHQGVAMVDQYYERRFAAGDS
ncbi:hypothetical protein [Streptomyces sp. Ag109_O5-1]|uniref:hypothetical protein n=1 Tax=Streptomyces sp. Ag109_O5-1 TaxID=1938851 RepID=UPI000F4D3CD1|nr:hypothetical protein [Streptomyces sp. Ag109_O5-1]